MSILLTVPAFPLGQPVKAALGDCSVSTQVANEADLVALAADPNCLDETWTQVADITLAADPWVPIAGFVGTYDGNSKSISGLRLQGNNAGLFGVGIDGATFKNLSVEVVRGSTNGSGVGALVGWSSGSLTIRNVSVSVASNISITGISEVGGLVGISTGESVTIINSHVNTNVVGDTNVGGNYVGGLIGRTTNGSSGSFVTVTNSSVTGNVTGNEEVGGVLGGTPVEDITITSADVTGNVTGDTNLTGDYVGGLIGRTTNGSSGSFVTVTDSSVTGNVTGGSIVGGVLGTSPVEDITITSADVTGNVTGDTNRSGDYVGGLIGWTTNGGSGTSVTIGNSSVDGNVIGRSKIGGAIGSTGAIAITITSANIAGDVTGDTNVNGDYVGGLVGWTTNGAPGTFVSVSDGSVTGDITGASYVGGFLGSIGSISVTIADSDVVGDVVGDTNRSGEYIGGFIGRTSTGGADSEVIITESSISGNVVGASKVAGLLGSSPALDITIESSAVAGNVTGDTNVDGDHVGGLVGWNTNGNTVLTISDSTVTGNVTGRSEVGGVLGSSPANSITITAAHVNGNVTGDLNRLSDYVGGLVGWNTNGDTILTISHSTVTGNVTGRSEVGGILGSSPAEVITITTTGVSGSTVGAGDHVGGVIGRTTNGLTVLSFSDVARVGNVTGRAFVGGVVGTTFADILSIARTAVAGNLTGDTNVSGDTIGGFVGFAPSSAVTITDSFVRGSISANLEAGGFIAWASDDVTLTNSYFVGTISASGTDRGSFIGKSTPGNLTITNSFCTDSDCPIDHTVTTGELKSPAFLTARQWDMGATWCVRPELNGGFPSLRTFDRGPLNATSCRPVGVAIHRVSLDPGAGTCIDSGVRRQPWTSVFVGYRYLPGSSDCTRPGFVFAGWADEGTPSQVRTLPLLDDPIDGARRFFVAQSLDLVAVWIPGPGTIDSLVVFANFLCGPCTNAWLIYTVPESITDITVSLDEVPATCAQVGKVFGLSLCEITNLVPGTHTVKVAPVIRTTLGSTKGTETSSTFAMRS